jgi:hypothetical protein
MSVKTDGATFKRYFKDDSPRAWPKDTYFDDDLILVDGEDSGDKEIDLSEIADSAVVEIKAGTVLIDADPEKAVAMTTHFKRWLKKQNTVTLLVEVPREKESAVRVAVMETGGKVIA